MPGRRILSFARIGYSVVTRTTYGATICARIYKSSAAVSPIITAMTAPRISSWSLSSMIYKEIQDRKTAFQWTSSMGNESGGSSVSPATLHHLSLRAYSNSRYRSKQEYPDRTSGTIANLHKLNAGDRSIMKTISKQSHEPILEEVGQIFDQVG